MKTLTFLIISPYFVLFPHFLIISLIFHTFSPTFHIFFILFPHISHIFNYFFPIFHTFSPYFLIFYTFLIIRLTVIASSAAVLLHIRSLYMSKVVLLPTRSLYMSELLLLPNRSLYISKVCCFIPVLNIYRRRGGVCKGAFSQLISQHLREGVCASAGIDHR